MTGWRDAARFRSRGRVPFAAAVGRLWIRGADAGYLAVRASLPCVEEGAIPRWSTHPSPKSPTGVSDSEVARGQLFLERLDLPGRRTESIWHTIVTMAAGFDGRYRAM
jgi:hypothetical protein